MADAPNIAEFKQQLMRVMADLYQAWPGKRMIEATTMPEDGLSWLAGAGLIEGRKLSHEGLSGAFLTRHAISLLQQPEQNAGGELLGKVVVAAVTGDSDREKQVVADLLGRRLLDI